MRMLIRVDSSGELISSLAADAGIDIIQAGNGAVLKSRNLERSDMEKWAQECIYSMNDVLSKINLL